MVQILDTCVPPYVAFESFNLQIRDDRFVTHGIVLIKYKFLYAGLFNVKEIGDTSSSNDSTAVNMKLRNCWCHM
jgi:hypothetical protein